MSWFPFLFGFLFGAGITMLAVLWIGVRSVQVERQRLVELRERPRP